MTAYRAIEKAEADRSRTERFMESWNFRRGDIYLAALKPCYGSEQGGTRPVIVLQNNAGNIHCPTLVVAPLTTHIEKKPAQPTHCLIPGDDRIKASMALLEQITTIDKSRIKRYITKVTPQLMRKLDITVETSLGLNIPLDVDAP